MIEAITRNSVWILAAVFFAVLLLETFKSYRPADRQLSRMLGNLGLGVFSRLIIKVVVPASLIGLPVYFLDSPKWLTLESYLSPLLAVLITLLAVDLLSYWLHRAFHRLNILWRLHRVHHSDPELDFTSSIRHHPLESLSSAVITYPLYVLVGFPPGGLICYVLLSQSVSLLAHSNTRLPKPLEKAMQWVFVTPDVHRIHHSIHQAETDSNYGTVFTFWDRLFKTYTPAETVDHDTLVLGLKEFPSKQDNSFIKMLSMPFKS